MEEWRAVVGYEGLYEVSNLGRVRRVTDAAKGGYMSGRIVKSLPHTHGYLRVGLYKDRKCRSGYIHRLVATAFIENPEGKREVNHKDGNKQNNRVENLEWMTTSENQQHAYDVLKRIGPRGEVCGRSKLTSDIVRSIRAAKADGETAVAIAKRWGVHNTTVDAVLKGKTWWHVT